jgi:hypothetical protein
LTSDWPHCSLGFPVHHNFLNPFSLLCKSLCLSLAIEVQAEESLLELLLSIDRELVDPHLVTLTGVCVVSLDLGQVGLEDDPAIELVCLGLEGSTELGFPLFEL